MKTSLLGLIFLGFTSLMHAQNEIAFVNVNSEPSVKPSRNILINSNYYSSFENKINSERIRKFQKVVANYDLMNAPIYSNERSQYSIVFEEGKNQIKAEYNQEGKIVQCTETFSGIRLPYTISNDVAKKYPGWEFKDISCHISYSENIKEEVIYKVAIQNGNKKKTLILNTADYSL